MKVPRLSFQFQGNIMFKSAMAFSGTMQAYRSYWKKHYLKQSCLQTQGNELTQYGRLKYGWLLHGSVAVFLLQTEPPTGNIHFKPSKVCIAGTQKKRKNEYS